ncbi:MAG: glyoxalase [Thermodesulfobacteriota bacterium]|nr:MAG: glyoxalase [Thermodesulfobacteriota bacterium]
MDNKNVVGRFVWHDLMTNDVLRAMDFYSELLGWEYQIEHSSDFVWKPGEGDYPLIIANSEAHGGFIEIDDDIASHWVAYVEVKDVDSVTDNAVKLGATIDRVPFDVPGVGQSAVIRDPQGAVICPFVPSHKLPAPSGTFLWDELITDNAESAKIFYSELFGWLAKEGNLHQLNDYTVFKSTDDTQAVGGAMNHSFRQGRAAAWVPYLATDDVDETVARAKTLGAQAQLEVIEVPDEGCFAILKDPTGAEFALFKPI